MGFEGAENPRLYIRLPVRIKDEFEIRDLHPDIIKVHLPRQKSRRWCIVEFENKDKLQEATVALKKVKINNKNIKVKPHQGEVNKNNRAKRKPSESTQPLLKLLKKIVTMGVTFIGNPFDQENDYDDSDWEMNADDEWIAPPQQIALFEDLTRGPVEILAADAQSEDSDLNWFELNELESDEDYAFEPEESDDDDLSSHDPDDDEDVEIDANNVVHSYVPDLFDLHDADADSDIDYVTYPIDEGSVSPDKPISEDNANNRESSGAD